MDYDFSGHKFSLPSKIINEMVIRAYEIEKEAEPSWIMNRDALPEMMRLILEGPHDQIDWLKQETVLCKKAYLDFFKLVTEKVTE